MHIWGDHRCHTQTSLDYASGAFSQQLYTQMSILWVTDTQMTPYGENDAHSTNNFSATGCMPFSFLPQKRNHILCTGRSGFVPERLSNWFAHPSTAGVMSTWHHSHFACHQVGTRLNFADGGWGWLCLEAMSLEAWKWYCWWFRNLAVPPGEMENLLFF